MLDVYLDSTIPPAIQVDLNHEMHSKLIKSLAKIMQLTHTNSDFAPFDDARAQLFKDLLPYWCGFKLTYKPTVEKPLTKAEKIIKERLEEFSAVKTPLQTEFKLPPIVAKRKDVVNNATSLQIVFSLATGIKYKDEKTVNLPNGTNGNGASSAV